MLVMLYKKLYMHTYVKNTDPSRSTPYKKNKK